MYVTILHLILLRIIIHTFKLKTIASYTSSGRFSRRLRDMVPSLKPQGIQLQDAVY